ncbi:MAG: GDSL-type esterase/lipase family protein [Paludibacter sp.]|jgi:hypothetical protein|nr:GDSL-type esterase/lipase family protein [Paludibacter sp.]
MKKPLIRELSTFHFQLSTLFVIFIFYTATIYAQSAADYKFIETDKNVIEISETGDSTLINNFFAKLDSFQVNKNGKISIVHIGGSHVQAGWLSNRIRENFGVFNPVLCPPPGIIFPYRAANTNNPAHYSVWWSGNWTATRNVLRKNHDISLGVTGMAIETADPLATITMQLNIDSVRYFCQFDTLILLGKNYGKGSLQPVIRLGDSVLVQPLTDSIEGIYTYVFPYSVSGFTLVFNIADAGDFKFAINGFLPRNAAQGVEYHALGVNGAAVPSYINCENFEKELALLKPDMMIFGIGINDAVDPNFDPDRFVNNYNLLLAKIRSVAPNCAFVFITNNDSFRRVRLRRGRYRYDVNKNATKVEQAFYRLAEQNAGAVWNQFEIMGGLRSMQEWEKAGLAAKDKIHFTKTGYQLLGDMFFEAMMKLRVEN